MAADHARGMPDRGAPIDLDPAQPSTRTMRSISFRHASALAAGLPVLFASPLAAEDETFATLDLATSEALPGGAFSATLTAPAPGAPALLVYGDAPGLLAFSNPNLPVLRVGLPYSIAGAGALDATGRLTLTATLEAPGLPYDVHLQGFALSGGRWFESAGRRLVVGGGPTSFVDESSTLPTEVATFGQVTSDADIADLNQDGVLDILLARSGAGASTVLLVGDGSGGFDDLAASLLPAEAEFETAQVAAADFDGDGLGDLLLCAASATDAPLPNRLLLGEPDGTYSVDPTFPGGAGVPVSVLTLDIDADADVDLVIANNPDAQHPGETPDGVVLYVNQGGAQAGVAGQFLEDAVFGALPGTDPHSAAGDLVQADFDGDGDEDVFVARADSALGGVQNQLFLNDGLGGFTEATGVSLPVELDNSYEATVADFDADGDLDVFVANSLSSDPTAIHLYTNTGNLGPNGEPVFVDGSAANIPADFGPVTSIRLAAANGDVDGDGDTDLIVAVHQLFDAMGNLDGRTVLLLNQGGLQGGTVGQFAVGTGLFTSSVVAGDVLLGDFDGDNDLDVYLGSTGDLFGTMFADGLYLNDL